MWHFPGALRFQREDKAQINLVKFSRGHMTSIMDQISESLTGVYPEYMFIDIFW